MGSDGRVHLVYELWMTNFSSEDVTVKQVEVMGDGRWLQSLDGAAIAGRLQSAGHRESTGKLAGNAVALLFLHVTLEAGELVPRGCHIGSGFMPMLRLRISRRLLRAEARSR